MDHQLSQHFRASEFACPCCGEDDVDPRLIDALEELRAEANLWAVKRHGPAARASIGVSSGCRCERHNRAVGGEDASLHMRRPCPACDCHVDIDPGGGGAGYRMPLAEAYHLALRIGAFAGGGIGLYLPERMMHLDVRCRKARWSRIPDAAGKKIYGAIERALDGH